MDTARVSKAYIYIIYPRNYDPNDIYTRQFYIGSSYNITDTKLQFYKDFYNSKSDKKIMLMRDYMSSYKFNIKEDKTLTDDKKLWQFRILFFGPNCCTKSLLKSLEGLYIYYYYSILNHKDEDIIFNPSNVSVKENEFFNKIGILDYLYKCYSPFTIEDLIYDVNPYTLIRSDATLKQFIHIYKEICERPSIPKFEDIDHLTFQYSYEEPVYPCYESGTPERPYKCKWCYRTYINYDRHLYNHLIRTHNDMYDDTFENFRNARNEI
jgi:hypothetical protein